MERSVAVLGELHRQLLAGVDGENPEFREALAASIPHALGLIEARVPKTRAVILRAEDVREMLLGVVGDLLEAQVAHVRTTRAREKARRKARPIPSLA